jgi:hypothetical protein
MTVAPEFNAVSAFFLFAFIVLKVLAPPYYGPPRRQLCVWLHTTI